MVSYSPSLILLYSQNQWYLITLRRISFRWNNLWSNNKWASSHWTMNATQFTSTYKCSEKLRLWSMVSRSPNQSKVAEYLMGSLCTLKTVTRNYYQLRHLLNNLLSCRTVVRLAVKSRTRPVLLQRVISNHSQSWFLGRPKEKCFRIFQNKVLSCSTQLITNWVKTELCMFWCSKRALT